MFVVLIVLLCPINMIVGDYNWYVIYHRAKQQNALAAGAAARGPC